MVMATGTAVYQQEERAYWAHVHIVDLSRDINMRIVKGQDDDFNSNVSLNYYQKIYYDALHRLSFLYGLPVKQTRKKFFKKYPELREL